MKKIKEFLFQGRVITPNGDGQIFLDKPSLEIRYTKLFQKHLPPTCDRGLKCSAFARRRGGDWFEFRPDIALKLKTLKMVHTADISGA